MADRKQEFLTRMGAELDAIDAQLDQYRAQLRKAPGAQRNDAGLESLKQQRDDIHRRSRALKDFDGENWDAAQRDIENARRELRRSLDEMRQRHH